MNDGQVEIEDAVLVDLAAGLLLRDEETVAEDGPLDDGTVRPGDEEFRGVDEYNVDSVLT